MFAFLLADMAAADREHNRATYIVLIAAALASAFGLSIFVPFGFLLVMFAWGVWQVTVERSPRPPLMLATGGVLAPVLLVPFLWNLTRASSKMAGGHVFGFWIREIIAPDSLTASPFFQNLAGGIRKQHESWPI